MGSGAEVYVNSINLPQAGNSLNSVKPEVELVFGLGVINANRDGAGLNGHTSQCKAQKKGFHAFTKQGACRASFSTILAGLWLLCVGLLYSSGAVVNWTNTVDQWPYAAGDTVKLWGTFGTTLTLTNSGTVGNPITFEWQNGAKFSKGAWGDDASSAIYAGSAISYVILDGRGVGIVEATNNGMGFATSNSGSGIKLTCGTGVEIRGLIISNLYYRVSSTECGGTTTAIYLSCDNATNVLVHNNVIDMTANGLTITYGGLVTNVQVYSNAITRINWGMFFNTGSPGRAYGFRVWANSIDHFEAWNPNGGDCAGSYHADGIFLNGSSGGATNYGMRIYRNKIGPSIEVATGCINMTPSNYEFGWSNMMIYNNLLIEGTNTTQVNAFIAPEIYGPSLIANNTMISLWGGGRAITTTWGNSLYNNLTVGVPAIISRTDGTPTNCNYNVWNGPTDDSFSYPPFRTFADWKTETGFDANSVTNLPLLNANYQPLTNDTVALGMGTNLTAFGITDDYEGNARPATGPWTIGAFEVAGADTPPALSPPKTFRAVRTGVGKRRWQ